MKRTKIIWPFAFTLMGVALILFGSCSKDDKEDDGNVPVLSTTEVTRVNQTNALSGGNISDDMGATVTARGVCWSTGIRPTINDSKTDDGAGAGSFISSISGLEPNTTYYVRAYATNSSGTGYGSAMSIVTKEEVLDADGNVYTTVVMGNQEWFAENLRTTKYNNGTPIPNITDNNEWKDLTSGAYAWQSNDEATYKDAYGALYNWYAVSTGALCPAGWRVPTDAEWATLFDYLGGETIAGGKLKSTRTEPDAHPRWKSPNRGATDEYGFSALPGESRHFGNGIFYVVGSYGFWWSITEADDSRAWRSQVSFDSRDVFRRDHNKKNGFSVRCLKDN